MPLAAGQILNNRYRIVKLLGQGGFGAVYRAWDLTFEVACAIKENSETSPEGQRQFLREARMLHTLRHPNLPLVKDYFVIPDPQGGPGAAYLVMDFVDGDDLEARLRQNRRPLDEALALAWTAQVCDALSYLHTQNPPVIHRDIKPANIKITPAGLAVLVDFGIAKIYDASLRTTVGARAVTPGFSPLEQYGMGGRTDARSDIYALGATLYTLLTGQPPPEAPERTPACPLPAPRSLNPRISLQTESAVLKAMEIYPENRFSSAADFKAALTPGAMPVQRISPPVSASRSADSAGGQSQHRDVSPAAYPSRPELPLRSVSRITIMLVVIALATLVLAISLGGLFYNRSRERGVALSASQSAAAQLAAGETARVGQVLEQTLAAEDSARIAGQTADISATQQASATQAAVLQSTQAAGTQAVLLLATRSAAETARALPPKMALIPAGEFQMGSESGNNDERPVHKVLVNAFYIDVYEVTHAQFAKFLNEQGNRKEGRATWFNAVQVWVHIQNKENQWQIQEGYEDHPVIGVTWNGAKEYCAWRGARLPTEAEWERAARGGKEGGAFPWGNAAPTCQPGVDNGVQYDPCDGYTLPVGSFKANEFGLFDMAGNVSEWVSDWYKDSFYSSSPYDNPDGPAAGAVRVARGGSWGSNDFNLRVAFRNHGAPGASFTGFGFRCARTP